MTVLDVLIGILGASWQLMLEAAPYILFGLVSAGLIRAFIPGKGIKKYLGQNNVRSIMLASFFGLPLPLCSCGVLPTAIGLKKQGASKSSILSFLISTPETSIDSMALTYALIGPVMAIFRPLAGFITAMVAGISELLFGGKNQVESYNTISCPNCHTPSAQPTAPRLSLWIKMKTGFHFAFVDLLQDMSKWFLIGILAAGVISYIVPNHLIEQFLGGNWVSMLIMLIIGIPLYVCASASTPIAAALLLKGMSPGAALVFLLAGPATNIASLLVLTKEFGKRSIAIYLGAISICSLLLGNLLNWMYTMWSIEIIEASSHTHGVESLAIQWIVALPLTIAMVVMATRDIIRRS